MVLRGARRKGGRRKSCCYRMIEITDEEAQRAIDYLVNSSENYAKWKSRMKFLEVHRKSVRAAEILRATGKTIAENTQRGEASTAYKEILIEYEEAVYEFTLIDSYRNAAETKIDLYRTMSASTRRGNI